MSSSNSDTRTRILNAAWALLEAGQGANVSMSDIAKQAGISRQALYLHFPTRADLLVATTHHVDAVMDVDGRLGPSRTAATGIDRLNAFIDAWSNYIPEIYGIATALMAVKDSDEAAAHAWRERMLAVRHGCAAAVAALAKDGVLTPDYSPDQATDILWALLSVRTWEHFTQESGWPQTRYADTMKRMAVRVLIVDPSASPT